MNTPRALWACLLALSLPAQGADPFAGIEITAHEVASDVWMLEGRGGNIGILRTDAGIVMVDDQFAPLADRIQAAIDAIEPGAPRFIINTHYHGDHTGSNPHFGATGEVVAHENVRVRLAENPDFPASGLPVITFQDRIRLHPGGHTVDVVHMPNGHTDGDSVVVMRDANVVHMGDHLFNGMFPFIDLQAGGTVDGVLRNLRDVRASLAPGAAIIPGHGPVTDIDGLDANIEMIEACANRVREAVARGESDTQIQAAGVDTRWEGWAWEFISEERWLATLIADARQRN